MKQEKQLAMTSEKAKLHYQLSLRFKDSSFLDGQYTVWGQVVEGMEFVDKIKRGSGQNGMVNNPDKIVSMKLALDSK